MKLLPVSFAQQILPGSFEYTLNELIDNEVDLTVFESRYRNGAPLSYCGPRAYLSCTVSALTSIFPSFKSLASIAARERLCSFASSAEDLPASKPAASRSSSSGVQRTNVFAGMSSLLRVPLPSDASSARTASNSARTVSGCWYGESAPNISPVAGFTPFARLLMILNALLRSMI